MTTYLAPLELRRVLVRFSRSPTGGTSEDLDVFTIHLAKITSGAVDSNWTSANYASCETLLDAFWTSYKAYCRSSITLSEYRWYKDGPVWSPDDFAAGPSNPADRVTARAVAGTNSITNPLPPQIAMSVTKIVPLRARWGRFYLPAPVVGIIDVNGRFNSGDVTTILGYCVTLFNGFRSAGFKPVVWSRGRSAYVTPKGVSIGVHAAAAYEITDLQIDNLPDVQRSRRFDGPTQRARTLLT